MPASKCTTGTNQKYKYLCSTKEPYDVSGILQPTKYDGTGKETFNCGIIPEFLHYERQGSDLVKSAQKMLYPKLPIRTNKFDPIPGAGSGQRTIQRICMTPMIVLLFFGKKSLIKMLA